MPRKRRQTTRYTAQAPARRGCLRILVDGLIDLLALEPSEYYYDELDDTRIPHWQRNDKMALTKKSK